MNIISYNFNKYQADAKLSNKKFAALLGYDKKTVSQMKKETYVFSEEEIKHIAFITGINEQELISEMHEKINLREKKIYGADFLNVRYQVLTYKNNNIGLISCLWDMLFLLFLAIMVLIKQFDLSIDNEALGVLKTICIIELLVFPFMYIVLPLLKIYFNRSYTVKVESNLKEEQMDEACGIVYGFLRRSINKSFIPHFFTIFSEGVIALYALLYMINVHFISWVYIVVIILFLISLSLSLYTFTFYFGKKQHRVLRS